MRRSGPDYIIHVSGAIAIANTIAYISELIDPIAVFLGLTRQQLMAQAIRFFLLGEGETGLIVYTTSCATGSAPPKRTSVPSSS